MTTRRPLPDSRRRARPLSKMALASITLAQLVKAGLIVARRHPDGSIGYWKTDDPGVPPACHDDEVPLHAPATQNLKGRRWGAWHPEIPPDGFGPQVPPNSDAS
jgi:hypothetical protein